MSTNGLEYTFAVNLINFVMAHRKMRWKFHKYFLKNIQSNIVTPTIQNFVLEYLEDEETNIYFLYMMVTKASKVDCDMFYYVVEHLRSSIFSSVNTITEVIRYCTLISQCSLLAYQGGAHLAPFVALKEVSEAMKIFISEREETSSTFWASLDSEVSELLPESFSSSPLIDSPMKQAKFLQEPTSDLDETLEEQNEQPAPEQVLEVDLKDGKENIQDKRKNFILTQMQANDSLQNEEERLLTQGKAIKRNKLQQEKHLQKSDQHEYIQNLLEKTDLPLECEKETNVSQQGFLTHTDQIQEIQIPESVQLLKLEVVKDLLEEPTLKIHNHPQNPDQLHNHVMVKSCLQQRQTRLETTVQQDQAQAGKAVQQDQVRVGKAMQQDKTRVEKTLQQDKARVGKAMQQDQDRVRNAVQEDQARVRNAVQEDQSRVGKAVQEDQARVGKAVREDLENIKNVLKEKGKNVVREDQKGNIIY